VSLSSGAPTVRVRNLDHHFGEAVLAKQVLFDIALDVLPGEITIMTGPSGSGKTTLMTLIGALRAAQSGSVVVLGRELRGLDQAALVETRRNIGFIFQHHGLFESLTAYQNVRMALELHGIAEAEMRGRAEAMMERLGLERRLDYKPKALSGGQKQRVAVARALVAAPRLVLADEPTAALDQESGRRVVEVMQQLAREQGTAVIIVTHDNRILDAADRIVSLVDGRMVSNVQVRESVAVCQFLGKCPVLSGLTPATLSQVAEQMQRETHPAQTVIFRQGEPGDKFYLVLEGEVEVLLEEPGGPRPIATVGPGGFFGEIALISGEPRTATVRATRAVTLYTLGKEQFNAALARSTSLKEQLLEVYFQRQR